MGKFGAEPCAEGVETVGEYRFLRAMGIGLFHGYLLARPQIETLPAVDASLWDLLEGSAA